MKRHQVPILTAAAALVVLAVLASQQRRADLLVLDWAGKAKEQTPPVAVLLEMGLKDGQPRDWSGRAQARGAKVVHREGYRFRPGDRLTGGDGWKASSHWGLRVPPRQPVVRRMERIATVGVVLHLAGATDRAELTIQLADQDHARATVPLAGVLAGKPHALWDGRATLRLVSTATPVEIGKTEDDHPAAAYGPDGTLWVAYVSYTLKDESRRVEQKPYAKPPDDFRDLYTPEFGDQLFVRYSRGGRWSEPVAVTGPKEDLVRCALAAEGDGRVWVVYSANRRGNYDLYARPLDLKTPEANRLPRPRLGKEQRLTTNPGPDLSPVMCTDQAGNIYLAWQAWGADGTARIGSLICRNGKWGEETTLPGQKPGENRWHPAIAAAADGRVAIAYDTYADGDYDVSVAVLDQDGKHLREHAVATSAKFEARPSVAYDAKGRLWVAYEEGPEKWGKDYGALVPDAGKPLYNERSVRVVCLDGVTLRRPVAELPTSVNPPPRIPFGLPVAFRFETAPRYAYPRIGLDGKGRVWLSYRQKFGTRYSSHPGSYWLSFARRLDGDRWTDPVEVHHSDGLLDSRPVLLPHPGGGLRVVHNTDGRYTTPEHLDNQIYAGVLDLPGGRAEPRLRDHSPGRKDAREAAGERAAVKRLRSYRIEAGGKTYRLLRGEFHRHCEISWDGGPDGSLEDMFRYAIDAAALDWLGNGDHDNGNGREYSWWLVQKFTDAYTAKAFTPLFCYERSVNYPMGHRNCLFTRRGVRPLPRLAQPDPRKRVGGVHAEDTRMLYRYLREMKGLCASHTSATGMGTDWRDNDPEVEPVVEIYQGDRMSYEKEGAPRAGYDPKSGKEPANIAGWFPRGYVNHALGDKGYRLGFESSSDHWSTHISYTVVLAERPDRDGVLDGLRRRHCYAATDNLVVDFRCGDHVMGDALQATAAPRLRFHVIGTARLAKIEVLKDSAVVATVRPGKADHEGTWSDPKPSEGTHYYYLRVTQEDGEVAWASPIWVEFRR